MIQLIIFDLDGVLVETKHLHYDALNRALGEQYAIDWNEHLSIYDGLKTNQKLQMLTERKGLPTDRHKQVWYDKQKYTLEGLNDLAPDATLVETFRSLVDQDYKIAVCSNSIRKTILTILAKIGVIQYIDYIVSNEDVATSKPHPEMYWKAISFFGALPEETLILEDSPHGLLAANRSNSHVMRVANPKDISYISLNKKIQTINTKTMSAIPKWKNEKLNVLIPMAGAGSRFEQAGYTFPKPLIDVNNKPMIQVVTDNLNLEANYVYVVQKKTP